MNKTGKVESFYFPTKDGMLKLHVYGFNPVGSWGEVYTTLNEQTVCVKGFHRQKNNYAFSENDAGYEYK